MRPTDRDPYRGRDPRHIPAYTVFDTARYLRLPEQTIRNWAYGDTYSTRTGARKKTKPLIDAEANARHDFSFSQACTTCVTCGPHAAPPQVRCDCSGPEGPLETRWRPGVVSGENSPLTGDDDALEVDPRVGR